MLALRSSISEFLYKTVVISTFAAYHYTKVLLLAALVQKQTSGLATTLVASRSYSLGMWRKV